MRAISAPEEESRTVYQICVGSITDVNLRNRLNELTDYIVTAADDYQKSATAKNLYAFQSHNCSDSDIILDGVTKKELKDLYSNQMVRKNKRARLIYDSLLSRAPSGRCPFCGMGNVSTLDHYLPKTKYPQLSVVPLNLIPSCKDCNMGKGATVARKAGNQILHPYFDHQNFINQQWLYAEVKHTNLVTICFYVQAPEDWDDISKERVHAHFKKFKLAYRYSVEASNEIAGLRGALSNFNLGGVEVQKLLMSMADGYAMQHTNSWQTAMFQALANDDRYCNGGFL